MIRLILTIVLSALAFVSMGANDCATSYHADIGDSLCNLIRGDYSLHESIFRTPDKVGNLYREAECKGRRYDRGGRLLWDGEYHYAYDCEGNLVHKSRRDINTGTAENGQAGDIGGKKKAGWFRLLFGSNGIEENDRRETGGNNSADPFMDWEPGDTCYRWHANGMLAKVTADDRYTIVHDYLGTPTQAYDSNGELVWEMLLDVYGGMMECRGDRTLVPFRYQGQYEDVETGLYYNRFRYYAPGMGMYISSDPIGLAGKNPTLYGYVQDVNTSLDPWGLEKCCLSAADMRKLGPAPKNMYNPHKHHIVREHAPSNWSPEARKWVTDSQEILAEVGIDINSSIHNFVWASNGLGNHSQKAAKKVYDDLSKVRGNEEAIKETLGSLGEIFSQGGFK